jgi:Putative peptidoglycan binding domain
MRPSWLTAFAIAGVATLLVGSARTRHWYWRRAVGRASTPSPAPQLAPSTQRGSPSIGTAPGKAIPGAAQPSAGQPGSGAGMSTGSKKATGANGLASSEQVKTLQKALQDTGMIRVRSTGHRPKTQAALRSYQKDQKVPETDRMDTQTLEKLGVSR